MFIDKDARAASLDYLQRPDTVLDRWQTIPSESLPERQMSAVLPTKPEQYAGLALVINDLIDASIINSQLNDHTNLLVNPHNQKRDLSGYQRLLGDATYTLQQAMPVAQATEIYQRTERTTRLIGTANPARYDSLTWQLYGGISTALTTSIVLLKELPRITEFHTGQTNVEFSNIAHSSAGLPWSLAMMSVDQLLTFQELAGSNKSADTWGDPGYRLQPDLFTVAVKNGQPVNIKFTDIFNIGIPKGFSPHSAVPATKYEMKLGQLANSLDETVVGCPITLLSKRIHQLWFWMIDAVEDRQLWGSD